MLHNANRIFGLIRTFFSANIPFSCGSCPRGYRMLHDLQRHIRVECGKEPQQACVICGVKFFYTSDLKKHMIDFHNYKSFVFI